MTTERMRSCDADNGGGARFGRRSAVRVARKVSTHIECSAAVAHAVKSAERERLARFQAATRQNVRKHNEAQQQQTNNMTAESQARQGSHCDKQRNVKIKR